MNDSMMKTICTKFLELIREDGDLDSNFKRGIISDFFDVIPEDLLNDFFENHFKKYIEYYAQMPLDKEETISKSTVISVYQGLDF